MKYRRSIVAGALAAGIVLGMSNDAEAVFSTYEQRQAYIQYIAPNSGMSPATRIRLLKAGYMVCEGLTGGVPYSQIVNRVKKTYSMSSSEAWTILSGAVRHLC